MKINCVINDKLETLEMLGKEKLSEIEMLTDAQLEKLDKEAFEKYRRERNEYERKLKAKDPFDEILGTSGLNGAADAMMILSREGRSESRGTLKYTGRNIIGWSEGV